MVAVAVRQALESPAIHYFLLKFNLPGRHVQCSTLNIYIYIYKVIYNYIVLNTYILYIYTHHSPWWFAPDSPVL